MKKQWQDYINIIQTVVKPALGCTEPIAAAYAAAVAAEMLTAPVEKIEVSVSDNLYKNAMGVFVPGTGKIGLAIAAAVGAIGGDASANLEVLAKINQQDVDAAQALIDAGSVIVKRAPDAEEFIYCYVKLQSATDTAEVTISGGHTLIVDKTLNGQSIFKQEQSNCTATGNICDNIDIDIEKIYQFATEVPYSEIKFILKAAELNKKLAEEGMQTAYGLEIGRTIEHSINSGMLADGVMNKIVMLTSAASDARMGGATLPAMSNFGSGNQGIAATLPVCIIAEHYQADDEKLARALIMSHLSAIYMKSYYPPLSAFCGNSVTSGAAAMAMVYLADGTLEQCNHAIVNVLSDCSGMVCDGAKSTCAMKVKTSTNSAVSAFLMAMHSQHVENQGIVGRNVEQTISNVGKLVSIGMQRTDAAIIDIMSA
ncbi:L-cysteine desulfidase family protein [Shewanella marina]|uniref:L-cysteine desulfidase family protein n=1 Tax=Shewanella marina TaxID=487319 RepID=UPI00046F39A8|nr:L-serine ammonia-lyase, iron-sulfur-dependent, subunit alpha [Shewanella marina]